MRKHDFFCAKIHKKTVPSTILEVFMDGHEISIKISFDFIKNSLLFARKRHTIKNRGII